ncbi:MAG: bifunctional aspartate kinase/homoserine dehydrogenase I [bacterium]
MSAATACRVLKFGGSSVGTPERLLRVIDVIAGEAAKSPVAVVVSAMGDSTDWLIEAVRTAASGNVEDAERVLDRVADLATSNGLMALKELSAREGGVAHSPQITPLVREVLGPLRQVLQGVALLRECTPQTLDLVMSFGERLSARLLAELLQARGLPGQYVDARQWIVTNDGFGAALVDWEFTRARLSERAGEWREKLPVNTGFLGMTPDGRTTTLGRNGSDYTATLLARGLDASEVVIWTDVSGVMTADPGLVNDAYPLARMSYMEALELANFGARMFHPRTMIPLIESSIPMRIQNTLAPEHPGTVIDADGDRDMNHPTSVTSLEDQTLLDIQWRRLAHQAQMGERVLRVLNQAGVTVWMATQAAHGQAVAVVIPAAERERAVLAIGRELELELERHEVEPVGERGPVTLLTLVAEAMGRLPNIAGRFFHALGGIGINVRAIGQGASERSISCVVDGADTAMAVRAVHAAFNFAHEEVNLLVLGKGVVGSRLLSQINDQREVLERQHDVRIKLVGIADSQRAVFEPDGLFAAEPAALLGSASAVPSDAIALLERLRRLPVPVLVDCSAADGMESLYKEAFLRGVHVVAANKKPLTGDMESYRALMRSARQHHRAYHYETTVGASLPVIETLQNIVRTGDEVVLIEGSFSGTLGYITGELMRGVPLSRVVRRARELGYTEPQPQDDLSGLDVARKALILARELGLELALEDVVVEPLVPKELLAETELDAFFAALERHDPVAAQWIEGLKAEQQTLRYLARVEPGAKGRPVLEVGPIGIPAEHPATRLRGAEAFVAFTTRRYSEYPLIVQGAGAGGSVTAAGVLADVLRVAQTLRGA